jgi:hypothetical protein
MIERVTKVTFPKDCKHAALHLRPQSGDAPHAPPLHAGATRNPRFDPAPSYSGPSSSRRGHHDSFIKRALKSIFCMCKTATQEINENRRDIIEIKSHLGLPADPYHELPEFDEEEETEEEAPPSYREIPNSDEDEDTSDEDARDDDE